MSDTQADIIRVCDEIKELLLKKNESYGDSAIKPLRVFSQSSPTEQIKVRIDDKISRIFRGRGLNKVPEDTIRDLIGYLILLLISEERDGLSQ